MGADEGYLLADQQTRVRLDALAALFDPSTFRHLHDLGIGAGWRCGEVGAGGMSVPRWLADQVGPTGTVVATDIDTRWLDGDGVRVLRHDVGAEEPPATGLDLVHARLVLTHVPRRDAALASMVGALRPGGWLVLEEPAPAPARARAGRRRRRCLLPDHRAGLHHAGACHRGADPRTTDQRRRRHSCRDRPAPRQHRLRRGPRSGHLTHDLGLGPHTV